MPRRRAPAWTAEVPSLSSRLTLVFASAAHVFAHMFMLFYATVVLTMGPAFDLSYADLQWLSVPGFVLFGAAALPAGWLGDRWSTVGMMAVFFFRSRRILDRHGFGDVAARHPHRPVLDRHLRVDLPPGGHRVAREEHDHGRAGARRQRHLRLARYRGGGAHRRGARRSHQLARRVHPAGRALCGGRRELCRRRSSRLARRGRGGYAAHAKRRAVRCAARHHRRAVYDVDGGAHLSEHQRGPPQAVQRAPTRPRRGRGVGRRPARLARVRRRRIGPGRRRRARGPLSLEAGLLSVPDRAGACAVRRLLHALDRSRGHGRGGGEPRAPSMPGAAE